MEKFTKDCQYGQRYKGKKETTSTDAQKKKIRLQDTRKIGCCAHVEVKHYIVFPQYHVEEAGMAAKQVRTLKEAKLKELKQKILNCSDDLVTEHCYFISLPTLAAHSGHLVGAEAGLSQRVNPCISQKINELVSEGIVDYHEVKRTLAHYVKHVFPVVEGIDSPSEDDRAFYPSDKDIQNHIYMAKKARLLSNLDQENLHLQIEKWRKECVTSLHFFRPYSEGDENDADKQCLLWVHQEKWQQELLMRYGNIICLLDATYKTTQYELPLFFLCVKTNVGYSVVGEFISQIETAESIKEALFILQEWNPSWKPKYFMVDYCEAEITALENMFVGCCVYICDFHREQAWERWVRDKKHQLTEAQGQELLYMLRQCVNAPPVQPVQMAKFKEAVNVLKGSDIWKQNPLVRQWLTNGWLSIPHVSNIIQCVICMYECFSLEMGQSIQRHAVSCIRGNQQWGRSSKQIAQILLFTKKEKHHVV